MPYGFLDVASTPSVRAVQATMGSDRLYQDFEGDRAFDKFTPREVAFIANRDSFYMRRFLRLAGPTSDTAATSARGKVPIEHCRFGIIAKPRQRYRPRCV